MKVSSLRVMMLGWVTVVDGGFVPQPWQPIMHAEQPVAPAAGTVLNSRSLRMRNRLNDSNGPADTLYEENALLASEMDLLERAVGSQ
ncbi:hypothetical protein MHYP_G00230270 [Metynnis hypsauchen]